MTEISSIGNYYGSLNVQEKDGRFYWIIENWSTDFSDLSEWKEIPQNLYMAILDYHNKLTS